MRTKLIVAGVIAFLVVLAAVLPARLLGLFLPSTVTTGTLTGSIWNGSTDALVIDNRPLGAFEWKVRPLHLFRGRLAMDATLGGGERELRGRFAFGLGGALQAWNVDVRWPVAALPSSSIPPGWGGNIQAKVRELAIDQGKVTKALGIIDAIDLRKPAPDALGLGTYRLTFDESSVQADTITAAIQDLEGPLQVTGKVSLRPDRTLVVNGLVATRANAPEAIANTLRYLGPPDAQGLRPFSYESTY